jgi:SAM-dependent methyltransferase
MTTQTDSCSICQNVPGNRTVTAREMMFGYKDVFEYLECGQCGCLRLKHIPENLEKYYPPEYFPAVGPLQKPAGLKRWLRHQRARYSLDGRGVVGRLLVKKFGKPRSSIFGKPHHYDWLARCDIDFSSKILEVGCGSGILLLHLLDDGFTNLTGLDPYITESVIHSEQLRILKDQIYNLEGEFDLIMLHHTFEHMPAPEDVLKQLNRLLKSGHHLLIRIPVAGSFAYKTYGTNWVQLDAPRHLFLHTRRSMEMLAERTGFEIADIVFDSSDFQFWASEQYAQDIPLRSERSYGINPGNSIFSESDIARFRQRASELNGSGQGDSACFYLIKP